MATEIWHDFGAEAPVTLVPSDGGRLEVIANGKTLFDRKAEGGIYPEMKRVREIKRHIAEMIAAAGS
jgi:predicted Rdx family selenoprotein